jgi:DNA-binding LytR/AlgR family response regulator
VVEARSGEEALALLRRTRTVDLVLTDYAMPGMTGLQLASAVATERPGMVILLSTGYAELPSDARLSLPRLSKPFDQAALAKAIEAAMREEEPKSQPDLSSRFGRRARECPIMTGAPRLMKIGATHSPSHYDAAANQALQSVTLRWSRFRTTPRDNLPTPSDTSKSTWNAQDPSYCHRALFAGRRWSPPLAEHE